VGWMYSARASEMRMRQPPEKDDVGRLRIASLNPAQCTTWRGISTGVPARASAMLAGTCVPLKWTRQASSSWVFYRETLCSSRTTGCMAHPFAR